MIRRNRRSLPLVGVAAAMVGVGSVAAQAPQPVTAFVDVAVLPMDQERVLPNQTVVVRGDKIVAMGPTKQVAVPTAATRIDGRGKFLMPGLADMHMHVALTGPRHAERILFLLLANGVTTIRNVDYDDAIMFPTGLVNSFEQMTGPELLQLRARLAAGALAGPRMYTSGQWYTDPSKSIAANVTAYQAAGYDFIKAHDEVGPIADSLIEAAGRIGMPVMGHPIYRHADTVAPLGQLQLALQHRFTSLEHLAGFPGYSVPNDSSLRAETARMPAVVAATRQAGTAVVPNLVLLTAAHFGNFSWYRSNRYLPRDMHQSYMYAGQARHQRLPQDTTIPDSARSRFALVGRLLRALQDAGVPLLVGTDSPLFAAGFSVHQELELLVRLGLTPYEALVAGTRNVAAYFGTLDSAGTVAVGKRADLVLLTANPLAAIRNTEQIAGVMAGGRWWPQAELRRRLDAYVTADAADAASPLASALVGRWRSPAFTERNAAGSRTGAKEIATDSFTAQTTFLLYADSAWLSSTTYRVRPDVWPDTVITQGGGWRRSGDTLWLAEASDSTWAKTASAYTPNGETVRRDTVPRPIPRITTWQPYQVSLHKQRLSLRRLGAAAPTAAAPFVCEPGAGQPTAKSDRLVCPGIYERQPASTP